MAWLYTQKLHRFQRGVLVCSFALWWELPYLIKHRLYLPPSVTKAKFIKAAPRFIMHSDHF